MGTKRRRPLTDLVKELERNPGGFDFFQAVRLLQAQRRQATDAVGGDLAPSKEVIRFKSHPTLAYPGSALRKFRPAQDGRAHELEVNFLSMVGVTGPLPLHYTEHLLARLQLRDRSLADFLDLFHHRSIALFFRAWRKYTFPFAAESGEPRAREGVSGVLRSLIGLGTPGLCLPAGLPARTWMFYAGHFSRPTRTAAGLESMVADICGHPVRLESFIGAWLELAPSARSRLAPATRLGGRIEASQRLGMGFVLGSRVWDVQSKIRLHVGPLPFDDFRKWMPQSPASTRLLHLIRSYLGQEVDFDLKLELAEGGLPAVRLAGPPQSAPGAAAFGRDAPATGPASGGLGRDSWLTSDHSSHLPASARVTVDNLHEPMPESVFAPA